MPNEIPFNKPVPDHRTIVNGIWSDILNAWLSSFEGEGESSEVRVNVKNLADLVSALKIELTLQDQSNRQIVKELKLLNERFEAAFETSLDHGDL